MPRPRISASLPPLAGLLAAAVVFVAVMLATPGFEGLRAVGPGAPRGVEGYAAAYALGAAAGLALLTLVLVAGVLAGLRKLLTLGETGTQSPIPMDGVKPSESAPLGP